MREGGREGEGERERGREGGREQGRDGVREGGREEERGSEGGRERGRDGVREGGREGMKEKMSMMLKCNCERSELSGLFNGTDFLYIYFRPSIRRAVNVLNVSTCI